MERFPVGVPVVLGAVAELRSFNRDIEIASILGKRYFVADQQVKVDFDNFLYTIDCQKLFTDWIICFCVSRRARSRQVLCQCQGRYQVKYFP
jgi:hypothetical protein